MKIVDNKCPTCDSNLIYDIKNKNFKCNSCNNVYNIDKLKKIDSKTMKSDQELICPTCSARIFFNNNSISEKCIYCNNNIVIQKTKDTYSIPDKIIPFTISEKDVQKILKAELSSKKLIPEDFYIEKNIVDINGIYIPFWLYINKYTVKIYHKEVYSTDTVKIDFNLIPFDANAHLDNALTKGLEPFNYKELLDFHPAFLSGFLAQKYDIESQKGIDEINKRCNVTINNLFKNPDSKYFVFNLKIIKENLNSQKIYYTLLPIWLLNVNYKNKNYLIAINGQTGKLSSNLPINQKKYNMIKIYLFLIFFMAFFVIAVILRWLVLI